MLLLALILNNNMGPFIALTQAIFGSAVCLIIPAILYKKTLQNKYNYINCLNKTLINFIMGLGIIMTIGSTIAALLSMTDVI